MTLLGQTNSGTDLKEDEIDFEEEDLVIDESDLGSFLTNHIESDSSHNKSSQNSDNEDGSKEAKEETVDDAYRIDETTERVYSHSQVVAEGSNFFTEMRSEIMEEIKSEEIPTQEYSSNSSYDKLSQYPHQYQQTPPPRGYQQAPSYEDYAYPPPPVEQFPGSLSYYQQQPQLQSSQDNYYSQQQNEYRTPNLTIAPTPRKLSNLRRRSSVGEEDWISDDGIPQGWKYRLCPGNNKTIVMGPSGKKFDGRKNALVYMRENNYPDEDVLVMDASLRYEGWKEHEYLPSGWKFKKGASMVYLTSSVKVLSTNIAAQNHIVTNYPREVLDNFNYFLQTLNKSKSAPSVSQHSQRAQAVTVEEWRTDLSIPSSWRLKTINGKEILLSPYGTQFTSRRQAFQALVEANYPDEEKADMFDKLACEGFKANELLPFGWIYQKLDGDINFLSRDGKLITSFRNAADFLVRNGEFTAEEVQKFKMFEKLETLTTLQPTTLIQRTQPIAVRAVWNENDQTIPLGWKSRSEGYDGLKMFLSPQGYELKSRRLALQHMAGAGYSEEDKEQMRQFLYYENWMDDQSLPHLWKMKRSGRDLSFVSKEGDLMESQSEAFSYIQKNPQMYNQDDLLRIQYISTMVKKSSEAMRRQSQHQETLGMSIGSQPVDVSNGQLRIQGQAPSRNLPNRPKQNVGQVQSKLRMQSKKHNDVKIKPQPLVMDPNFISDDTVPSGWFHKTEGKITYVRAPDGTAYRSRRSACQAMINFGLYSNEEIEEMRSCLKHEGWLDSPDIPAGWKIKKRDSNATLLMGRGGEFFKSSVEGARFIQNFIQYFTQDDVDKINNLARINQPHTGTRVPLHIEWNEDSTVPAGWKTKKGIGRGVCLQDPSGNSFMSRRKALQHLVKSGGNTEVTESIRSSLIHDGWKAGGDELPPNWYSKLTSTHCYLFISSEGELLKSKANAIQYLVISDYSSGVNKTLIENFRNPNMRAPRRPSTSQPIRREPVRILHPDESWLSGDDSLPSGWKFKEVRVGSNKPYKVLLSASGHKFRSRRVALSFMISQSFPEADIVEMREMLVHDGWSSHTLLPEKWSYKNVKQPFYCNEVGDLLASHQVAIEYLKNSEIYSSEDVDNLMKYISKIGGRLPSNSESRHLLTIGDVKPFETTLGLKRILESAVNKEELFTTLTGLGWKEQSYLPSGWLYREKKETDKCIFLISREGKLFQTYKAAVMFMKSTNFYTSEDIESLYLFPDGNRMHAEKRRRRTGDGIGVEQKVFATDDDWVEDDDTIPNGWKSKIASSGQKCFLSREKQVLMSRRGALKMLIKSEAVVEEVEDMRSLLIHDGWEEFSLLPQGWRVKKKNQSIFMTRNGDLIKTNKDVLKYMRSSDEYTSSHEEDFRKFVAEQLQGRRPSEISLYTSDLSSSYSGHQVTLLRKLYIQGGEEESLEKLRSDLVEKGWKTNEYLPGKWLYRERSAKSPHMKIVSEEGIRFASYKSVFSFMEMTEKYSEEDIELFKSFPNGKAVHQFTREQKPLDSNSTLKQILESSVNKDELMRTLEGLGWKEHLYLPTGWLYKERQEGDKSINVISKEGRLFQSYKAAVLFMRAIKLYSDDDIKSFYLFPEGDRTLSKKRECRTGNGNSEETKVLSSDEDWSDNDSTVPNGWKSKADANGTICLLSPNGQVMLSRRSAMKMLIKTGSSEEEVDEMRSLLIHDGWQEFSLLPGGWRFKKKGIKNFYMTKNGSMLKTHKDALEYIKKDEKYRSSHEEDFRKFMEENLPKKGQYGRRLDASKTCGPKSSDLQESLLLPVSSLSPKNSKDGRTSTISELRKLYVDGDKENAEIKRFDLMMKGWKESDHLPKKWLFKERTEKSPHLKVLSEEGIKFSSFKSVVQFMQNSEKYSDKDVQSFKKGPNEGRKKIKLEVADVKAEYLPEQEKKLRKYTPRHYGQMLKEGNYEELLECKKYLLSRGWLEDVSILPPMWMFRRKPGFTCFNFLTPKGEQILSTKKANRYLTLHKIEYSIDAKKLKEKTSSDNEGEVKEEPKNADTSKLEDLDAEEEEVAENIKEKVEVKEEIKDIKIPTGITLKKVDGTVKMNKVSPPGPERFAGPLTSTPGSLSHFSSKDAAGIVEKFKTVNSGLKISISSSRSIV